MKVNERARRRLVIAGGVAALAAGAAAGITAPAGQAAFPGNNGLIVFSSNRPAADGSTDFEIYSMNADGIDVRQLTDNTSIPPSTESGGSGSGQGGSGSGQGGSGSGQGGGGNGNGSGETGGTTPTPIDDTSPAVSPNGKEIAFVSNRPAANGKTTSQIYVMNLDGSDVRQITHDGSGSGSGNDYEPAWSPDGKQIVYRHDDGTLADLYIVDVKTGVETQIVTPSTKGPSAYDGQPSWSPDGTEIVFRKGMGSQAQLWVYNLLAGDSASAARPLIYGSAPDSAPSWSPNGKQIVFVQGDEGAGAGIWVANANGTDAHAIDQPQPNADGLVYSDLAPRWSPNGKQIIFQSTRDGILGKPETESTSGDTGSGSTGGQGGPGGEEPPVAGNIELYVMNADGSGQTRLTNDTSSVDGPQDLSPDWQTIPLPPENIVPPTPTPQQLTAPVVEVPVSASPKGNGALCLNRRVERIQVRVTSRDRARLWAWWVSVNGKRVQTSWKGTTLTATADMRNIKGPHAKVSITVWLTGIVRLTAQRSYETCNGARGGVSTFHLVRQTHPTVTLSVSSSADRAFRLGGTVKPGHTGQQVMIQRKVGSEWRTVATTPLRPGRSGLESYGLTLRRPRAGFYRAYVETDQAHLRSNSRTVRLG